MDKNAFNASARILVRHSDHVMRDHRVHGRHIMPGVTFLDLIYRLFQLKSIPPQRIQLSNILFSNVVSTSEEMDRRLWLSVRGSQHHEGKVLGLSERISTGSVNGGPKDSHLSCDYHWVPEADAPLKQISLPQLIESSASNCDMDAVYALARKGNIQHGSFMKGLGRIFHGPDFLLAEMTLSKLAMDYQDQFVLHPALLDCATAIPFLVHFSRVENPLPMIPIHVVSFRAFQRLQTPCFALVRFSQTKAPSPDLMYSDIELFNADGTLAAEFRKLSFKTIRVDNLLDQSENSAVVTFGNGSDAGFTSRTHRSEDTPLLGAMDLSEIAITSPGDNNKLQPKGNIVPAIDSAHFVRMLQEMIARRVERPIDEIDRKTSFYDLGLDSKDLLDMVSELERNHGRSFYPTLLFEYNNIEALAGCLSKELGAPRDVALSSHSNPSDEAPVKDEAFFLSPQWIEADIQSASREPAGIGNVLLFYPASDEGDCSGIEFEERKEGSFSQVTRVFRGDRYRYLGGKSYAIDPSDAASYRRLFQALSRQGQLPQACVILLRSETFAANGDRVMKQIQEGVLPTTRFLRALVEAKPDIAVRVIHCFVEGSSETHPLHEAVGAWCRTVSVESRGIEVKTVTIDHLVPTGSIQSIVESETSARPFKSSQIAYRDHKRWIRILKPTQAHEATNRPPPIKRGATYLITGGLGGVGMIIAEFLMRNFQAICILVGRSAMSPEQRERLCQLELGGARALYYQGDISKSESLKRFHTWKQAQRLCIQGVFHCAGVLRDSLWTRKTEEELLEVLAPKVVGTIGLDEILTDEPLDFLILFSSTAAVKGNLGQSDYALANAFLDHFAEWREHARSKGLCRGKTISLNWPLWKEGGMRVSAEAQTRLAELSGMKALDAMRANAFWMEALKRDESILMPLFGDVQKLQRFFDVSGQVERFEVFAPLNEAQEKGSEPGGSQQSIVDRSSIELKDPLGRKEDLSQLIAVIGLSGRYPQASDLDKFWENLVSGKNCVTEVPPGRWNLAGSANEAPLSSLSEPSPVLRWGGFLEDIDQFDALLFRIAPKDAARIDPEERLMLQTVWETLEDAGYTRETLQDQQASREKGIGVFVGCMYRQYPLLAQDPELRGILSTFSNSGLANRISYFFNFKGPSLCVDTACSSSLTAIHFACESLRNGECLAAFAGGVNLSLLPQKYTALDQADMLGSGPLSRSLGDGDGFVPGEGVGGVLLKPLGSALEDNDQIYGIIRGTCVNHGGATSGFSVPSSVAQAELIERTLRQSNTPAQSISCIEVAANGSSLGDAIEVAGLRKAFPPLPEMRQPYCALGSVKSNIGHLEAASGISQLTKVLLQMRHRKLVPSLNSETLNPKMKLDGSPFYVQKTLSEWNLLPVAETSSIIPRRAAINSFGAGGSNAHMIVEEFPSESTGRAERNSCPSLVLISARDESRLDAYVARYVHYLKRTLSTPKSSQRSVLCDIAVTSQIGREPMRERLAIVATSVEELLSKCEMFLKDPSKAVEPVYRNTVKANDIGSQENDPAMGRQIELWLAGEHLPALAKLWVQGHSIDWNRLPSSRSSRRITIPFYPFEPRRHWLSDVQQVTENRPTIRKPVEFPPPAQNPQNGSTADGSVADEIRKTVVRIIANQLNVAEKDIFTDENLSVYGFDSISITELAEKINQTYRLELKPPQFFEFSSIEVFVQYLTRHFPLEVRRCHRIESLESNSSNPEIESHRNGKQAPAESSTRSENEMNPGSPRRVSKAEPIAIVGMAGILPQSEDLNQFWDHLRHGRNLVSEIPSTRWDWRKYWGNPVEEPGKSNSKWGGFIPGVEQFDAFFFGISPREARLIDPQQRLLLQTTWKCIEDAGYRPSELKGTKTGVFVGVSTFDYRERVKASGEVAEAYSATGLAMCMMANRISYVLDWHGPSETVDTACSSSLVAVHRAVEAIQSGDCCQAIAGGANILLNPDIYVSFSQAGMLSPDGQCKTFDHRANGYVRGEGVGALFLKPLRQAEQDGDSIYGVILASSVNHGGHANSLTTPNPNVQADLLLDAYRKAGVSTESIGYVEAHGTGTALGDPVEINGLRKAFEKSHDQLQPPFAGMPHCGLGSVKTNIGHLESAAGIAGMFKVLLALRHQQLPATLHFERLNPYIDLQGTPFFITDKLMPWPRLKDGSHRELPRRAGISSFGFGGTNAHVVVEEYESLSSPVKSKDSGDCIVLLSAKNTDRLVAYSRQMLCFLESLETDPDLKKKAPSLSDIAYTTQVGREQMTERLAIVTNSLPDLIAKLQRFVHDGEPCPRVFRGNTKRSPEAFPSLIEGREGEAFLKILVEDRKFDKLAALWASGSNVDWRLLYGRQTTRRVSLPTYPFEPVRHWIDEAESIPQDRSEPVPESPIVLEIDPNDGLVFRKTFHRRHSVLADHRVHGKAVLPGVVHFELALEAARQAEMQQVLTLHDVVFESPLIVENESVEISVYLKPADAGFAFEIATQSSPSEQPHVHSRGRISSTVESFPEDSNDLVNEIIQRCATKTDPTELYQEFDAMGLHYGRRFRSIRELYSNDQEAIGILEPPKDDCDDWNAWQSPPWLLDGALQCAAVFARESKVVMMPFGVESFRLIQRIPERAFAHVRRAGENGFDIAILDDAGRVCMRIEQLMMRPASSVLSLRNFIFQWQESPLTSPVGLSAPDSGCTLVVANAAARDLARALAGELPGQVCRIGLGTENQEIGSYHWEVNPSAGQGLEETLDVCPEITSIYFLSGTVQGALDEWNVAGLESILTESVWALFRILKRLLHCGRLPKCRVLKVVTQSLFQIHLDDPVHPGLGALQGLSTALVHEFPDLCLSAIDLETRSASPRVLKDQAASLIREPAHAIPVQAAVRDGIRYQRIPFLLEPPVAQTSPFRDRGVYMIVGGTGGIGSAMAAFLCSRVRARVALIGRRDADESIQKQLTAFRASGGEGVYIRADVADLEAMRAAVSQVKGRWGLINGVVHSALVLNDKKLDCMDEESFKDVLMPKVHGSVVLAGLFAKEPLDFMLFFSSAVSLIGSSGQSNYIAACAFKDALANALRQRVSYPVKTIHWGYWGSVGVVSGAHYQERLRSRGVGSIEPEEGMRVIECLLASRLNHMMPFKAEPELLKRLGLAPLGKMRVKIPGSPSALENLDTEVQMPACPDAAVSGSFAVALKELNFDLATQLFRVLFAGRPDATLGSTWSLNALRARFGVVPSYHPLLDALFDILVQYGWIQRIQASDGSIQIGLLRDDHETHSLLDAWCDEFVAKHPRSRAFLELALPCLRALPDVLRGKLNPLDVLFPNGSFSMVESIYCGNPITDYYHELVANLILACVRERLKHAATTLHLLEVGAGTGGTTRFVLEALEPYKERIIYHFTDVSKAFTQKAQQALAEKYSFTRFHELDIEQSCESQGLNPESMDLVFGSNVFHATRRLRSTLGHVNRLLKPGGVCLLDEAVQLQPFATLTFGLTPGWWLFEDGHRRIPGSPLSKVAQWKQLLHESGFQGIRQFELPDINSEHWGQSVLIAETNGQIREPLQTETPADPRNSIRTIPVEESFKHAVGEVPASSRERDAVEFVRGVFARVLKMPASRFDTDTTLEAYGVDSLVVMELNRAFEKTFGKLPMSLLFEKNTIRQLAVYFLSKHGDCLPRESLTSPIRVAEPPSPSGVTQAPAVAASKRSAVQSAVPRKPSPQGMEIAIVGMKGRYPGARTLGEFWSNLKAGRSGICEVPRDRWNWEAYHAPKAKGGTPGKSYSKWGGFIDGAYEFDPMFFQISPREAERMDPQERLFLQTAWEVIEDAGYTPESLSNGDSRVGVFVGAMNANYEWRAAEAFFRGQDTGACSAFWSIANRVSYLFNFQGPSLAVDTACSSSLTAIHLACQSLRSGECHAAIAGGVSLILHPMHFIRLSHLNMLSEDGCCKSFGDGADGFVDGEGVGAVLLKPLANAVADGDSIYAVIQGSAINSGGKTSGYTVPNPQAQSELVRCALKDAGWDPATLSYIEAHGTGTSLGDPIEIAALQQAIEAFRKDKQFCSIGSVKSNIGHLESAAGIAGLTKTVLQIQHRTLVPSLNAAVPNQGIHFEDTPFRLQKEVEEWKRPQSRVNGTCSESPRRAGLSSFGAGGANAHLLLEEYSDNRRFVSASGQHLILLSAQNRNRLREQAQQLLVFVESRDELMPNAEEPSFLESLAYTLQVGRVSFEDRLAVLVSAESELCGLLRQFLEGTRDETGNLCYKQEPVNSVSLSLDEDEETGNMVRGWIQKGRLGQLAKWWVAGGKMDWRPLHAGMTKRRIALPTYPFAREFYSISSPSHPGAREAGPTPLVREITGSSTASRREFDMPQPIPEMHVPVWKKLSHKPIERNETASSASRFSGKKKLFIVFETIDERTHPLRSFLGEGRVVTIREGAATGCLEGNLLILDPNDATGFKRLFEEVNPEQVVVVFGQADSVDAVALDWDALKSDPSPGIQTLLTLVQVWGGMKDASGSREWTLFTTLAFHLPGDHRTNPCHGWASGFIQSAALEYPAWKWTLFDVDADFWQSSANSRWPELLQNDSMHGLKAIRSGCLYERRFVPALVPKHTEKKYRPNGVYLIVGGAGGVGFSVAAWLAEHYQARLILMGRRPLDSRIQEQIEILEQKGGTAIYLSVDICDEKELSLGLARAKEKFGPMNGVFHSAAVLKDGLLRRVGMADFNAVFQIKARGSVSLSEQLQSEPLDFLVFFSSLVSLTGNAGQGSYAAGGAFQDALAHHLSGRLPFSVRVINWGYWGAIGLAANQPVSERLERVGFRPLTHERGNQLLEQAIAMPDVQIIPVLAEPDVLRQIGFDHNHGETIRPIGKNTEVSNGSVDTSELRHQTIGYLKHTFSRILKWDVGRLETEASFEKFGIDSLIVTEILAALERDFGPLPSILMMDRITIGQLSDYFISEKEESLRPILNRRAALANGTGTTAKEALDTGASQAAAENKIALQPQPSRRSQTISGRSSEKSQPPPPGEEMDQGKYLSDADVDECLRQLLKG